MYIQLYTLHDEDMTLDIEYCATEFLCDSMSNVYIYILSILIPSYRIAFYPVCYLCRYVRVTLVVGPPDLGPLRPVPALSEVGGEIILARVPWVGVNCKVLQS